MTTTTPWETFMSKHDHDHDYAPKLPARDPEVEFRRIRKYDAPEPPRRSEERTSRDPKKPTASDVRSILDDYFRIEGTTGAQSKTGRQLEHGRLGLAPTSDVWASKGAAEDKLHRLGVLRGLWDKIEPHAVVLIRLTQLPCGTQRYERLARESELVTYAEIAKRQHGLCLEGLEGGGLCKRPLAKNSATCEKHTGRVLPMGRGGETKKGEVFVRRATRGDLPTPRTPKGENPKWHHDHPGAEDPATAPAEGYVIVAGEKPIHATYEQIAQALHPDFDHEVRRRQPVKDRRREKGATVLPEQLREVAVAARELLRCYQLEIDHFCEALKGPDGEVSPRRVKDVTLSALHKIGETSEFGLVWGEDPEES